MKGNTKSRMENREAIHLLNEIKQMDDSMYAYNPAYMEALNLAISALENEDWIKCSERQPEESDLYLVTVDKDYFPENCSQVDFLYWDSEAKESYNEAWNDAIGRAEMEIESLDPDDVAPVRRARWEKKNSDLLYCSECGLPSMHNWPYCEQCGAKTVLIIILVTCAICTVFKLW